MKSTSFGRVHADWRLERLPEVLFYQEGPGLRRWQWTETGMKVINGKNILTDGSLDTSNTERFISEEEFATRYRHFAIDAGDIVVTSSGTIGKVARIKPEHLPMMMNTSVIRFRSLDDSVLLDEFAFAFLRSPLFATQAEVAATGAAQRNFGPAHLRQMDIPIPPLGVQRKIGAMLAAYDELIENNLRRIKILEDMAEAVYREWFVNFHFPGHEGETVGQTPKAEVPSTWTVTQLGDHVELAYGKALKAEERTGGAIPVYGSSGVIGWHDEYLVPGPGIVVGRKGNVGSVFWTEGDFYPIDTTFYVRSNLPMSYLYHNLQLQHFLNSDAAVPGLNRNQAYTNPLNVPPDSILGQFDEIVQPMVELRRNLERQNEILRHAVDLLLPRLVSGEIDVSDLDVDTEWLAS